MNTGETRELVMIAALKLFRERGFETVSVRDVTKEANVNLASVNYHFGNKDGLIMEATSRILDPFNTRRIELLAEVIKSHGGIESTPIRSIFHSFLKPLLVADSDVIDHVLLAKLAAKHTSDPEAEISEVTRTIYRDLLVAYVKAIYSKIPELTPEQIRRRLVFTSGAALQYIMLGTRAASLTGEAESASSDEILENLLDFTLHGFQPITKG